MVKWYRKYLGLLALGMTSSASITLAFIKYTYYDAWVAGMQCTNEQAGYIMAIYGLTGSLSYVPGGWLADRYSIKKILMITLIASAVMDFIFAAYPSAHIFGLHIGYPIWFGQAMVSGFALWAAMLKGVRLCGTTKEQGKMYGIYGAVEGLFTATILFVAWIFFSRALEANESQLAGQLSGLKLVVNSYGIFSLLTAAVVYFCYDDPIRADDEEPFRLRELGAIVKKPAIWYVAVMVFCTYGLYTSYSYFAPWMSEVLLIPEDDSVALSIFRTAIIALIIGPLAGMLADKYKSSSKIIVIGHIIAIIFLFILITMPLNNSQRILCLILMYALTILMYGTFLIMYSTFAELNISTRVTGTAVGFVSILGYSPDIVVNPVFGYFMDTYGVGGYRYIFMSFTILALFGATSAFMIRREALKVEKEFSLRSGSGTPMSTT
ncbi:MAG: MFS transporter [Deltaproteobacteria bacterium]|jgi:nitrate/nitrite transporter NarK|nr:MFS transporter [Deltaproteobacteria bacterium]